MNIELTEKLWSSFPNLYSDKNLSPRESLICFGFEVNGDGWFQLLWDLSEKLEKIIIEYKEKNPEDDYFPRAVQVKEKYGQLCFYMTSYLDEFDAPIQEAEYKSAHTCEVCGKEGQIMTRGNWLKTLCNEHSLYKTPWGGELQYQPLK